MSDFDIASNAVFIGPAIVLSKKSAVSLSHDDAYLNMFNPLKQNFIQYFAYEWDFSQLLFSTNYVSLAMQESITHRSVFSNMFCT